MEKVWYIGIQDKVEGPFTLDELLSDKRITLDTLVWKEGFSNWLPVRDVPELKGFFTKEAVSNEPESDEDGANKNSDAEALLREELVLRYSEDFPPFFLWLIIMICLLLYIFYHLQNS